MSKIAVVYWSGTGNTEAMAKLVMAGVVEKGGEAVMLTPEQFDGAMMDQYDAVAFGCPSMGDEELEGCEFAPMFDTVEPKLNGKKIALFGSYGWGDGQWMRDWEDNCKGLGANLVADCVICNGAPAGDSADECKALGAALV